MSHKVHPFIFRLGKVTNWKSRWFSRKAYQEYLEQDYHVRTFLFKTLDRTSINDIQIERSPGRITVFIHTSRPGLIIGRGGAGVEEIKQKVAGILRKMMKEKIDIKIEIQEVRKPETHARLVALNVAEQLEKRKPFRRILKQTIDAVSRNQEVKGLKIAISGRLGGTEMARTEWLKWGRLPLQTLRAEIDYAYVIAGTTWGAIGVKVWIFRGEVFEEDKDSLQERKSD